MVKELAQGHTVWWSYMLNLGLLNFRKQIHHFMLQRCILTRLYLLYMHTSIYILLLLHIKLNSIINDKKLKLLFYSYSLMSKLLELNFFFRDGQRYFFQRCLPLAYTSVQNVLEYESCLLIQNTFNIISHTHTTHTHRYEKFKENVKITFVLYNSLLSNQHF